MKSKSNQNIIIVVSAVMVLLIGVTLYILYFSKDHWNWGTSYNPEDKNPYGAALFHELLEKSNPDEYVFTVDSLCRNMPVDPTDKVDNYLFLGERAYIDSADATQIIQFIEKGNNAFFFCQELSNRVVDSLIRPYYSPSVYEDENTYEEDQTEATEAAVIEESTNYESEEYTNYHVDTVVYYNDETGENETLFVDTSDVVLEEEVPIAEETEELVLDEAIGTEWYQPSFFPSNFDTIISLELQEKKLSSPALLSEKYDFKVQGNYWRSIEPIQNREGDLMETLGSFDVHFVNFVRIPVGKGYLYLHSTPLAFTNLPLSNDSIMQYAQLVSTYFGKGKIYWDEENRNYDSNAFKKFPSNDEETGEGPLEFILSEPSLRTAWYLLLMALILYVFFGAKRKQRIIPVTERMENTSIEYAEVISQLFMRQRDHKSLVKLKSDLFKVELRERYGLRVPLANEDENDEWFLKVSQKTGVSIALIKRIYERIHYFANAEDVNTEQMLIFHNYLEEFNATAR
jgi:hypothetical protein